ncbi:DNA-binding response OmpR family regulator [Fontibacillus solani]|uniref:DNA-binding response OmpR family regulator n=1 Tax=Fontibacillus solani TaxID=1572857 RepID=A0A7W3SPQ8_9BACL|nr:response regulator transcription factor [Fontibacillus solani]MBA9083936.1 DNA-binding response OmpR family regulator [Fontibacillus solani]
MKIMIVEDDETIREELSILVSFNGYSVCTPVHFSNILIEVASENPNLILMDINLPGIDGFKLCSLIREESGIPIIFVTSRNTDMDELNGIMRGGDDFITKPYNASILLARITALLRRAYPNENKDYLSCKDVYIYSDTGKVYYHGESVELTKNESKILTYLFKHQEKMVPRADLVEYLWDNQLYIDDNALSVHITRLRSKLSQVGIDNLIQTKYGQGYKV